MYTSKLKRKTFSLNVWRSLCWWPDLSDCLITSSISEGKLQKKPADHNCWDDGEARREDLGWQSEDVVWRRHWRLCFQINKLWLIFWLINWLIDWCGKKVFHLLCVTVASHSTVVRAACFSGVTRIGVTRCGNWWCHLNFFPSKKLTTFFTHRPQKLLTYRRHHSTTLCKIHPQTKFLLSSGCHPLDGVTRVPSPL